VIEGVLNLNKPRGLTSHDVVQVVRALAGVRRVGHAGTLDPLAEGVLVVCVGRATRIVEYLLTDRKKYLARVHLGATTDTLDTEGTIVSTTLVEVDRRQVAEAMMPFRGRISQVPPMYSAIKHQGVPLHRLARQGVWVDREPRQVEIFELELTDWMPPEFSMEVECSAGTYIRSLAHDLGQALGCGAYLAGLTRLASGKFLIEDAVALDELESAARDSRLGSLMYSLDEALVHLPWVKLGQEEATRFCSGQAARIEFGTTVSAQARTARAHGPADEFLGIGRLDAEGLLVWPHKVFLSSVSRSDDADSSPAS
jgi:tRNA pseudouridine55 synthase